MSVALIRQSMVTAVRAISPLLHAGDAFRDHDGYGDFAEFCEKNPAACFRLFHVRGSGVVQAPTANNTDVEWIDTEIQCAVAYPLDFRAGPLMSYDLDDLIESDLRQLEYTIGTNGYSALEAAVSGTVTTIEATREDGDACVFALLRLRARFWRAIP